MSITRSVKARFPQLRFGVPISMFPCCNTTTVISNKMTIKHIKDNINTKQQQQPKKKQKEIFNFSAITQVLYASIRPMRRRGATKSTRKCLRFNNVYTPSQTRRINETKPTAEETNVGSTKKTTTKTKDNSKNNKKL
jgi:hypothetical protein